MQKAIAEGDIKNGRLNLIFKKSNIFKHFFFCLKYFLMKVKVLLMYYVLKILHAHFLRGKKANRELSLI